MFDPKCRPMDLKTDHLDLPRSPKPIRRALPFISAEEKSITEKTNNDNAIAEYTKAIEVDGGNATAYRRRGISYSFKEGGANLKKAMSDLNEAVRLAPRDWSNYSARALVYEYDVKDYDRALADLRKVQELDPNNSSVKDSINRVQRRKNQ